MRTLRNKKGDITGIALGVVVALIFLAVMLPVALSVWQSMTGAVTFTTPSNVTTALQNSTYTINAVVQTNLGSGFSLLAIAPLVLAAGGIIALLVFAFMRMRGG
jgi:hypothetical protein